MPQAKLRNEISGEAAAERTNTGVAILDHAARLFAEQGYGQTSIREIAEAAGVTKPMLYYYFGNKAGLVRELVDQSVTRFMHGCALAKAETSLIGRFTALSEDQIRFSEERPAILTLMLRLDATPPSVATSFDLQAMQAQCLNGLVELMADFSEELRFDLPTTALSYLGLLVTHLVGRMRSPAADRPGAKEMAATIVYGFLGGFSASDAPVS